MKISFNRLDRLYQKDSEKYLKACQEVLESGWYILGKNLKAFEENFARYCGCKYCVGVANGTDALILSFKALGIGQGDEVIVPSNTYIATVMGITKNMATPIFVEPDEFYNIDADKIEEAITANTKAICVVHLYGQVANMTKINELAKKYNLKIVEDCAQAHGASLNGIKTGNFGDLGCFSFYPTKNLGAFGDAGAVVCNDEYLYKELVSLRNYGSSKTYYFDQVGFNSRLDELQAALLNIRLEMLDDFILERRKIAKKYLQGIKNPKIELPKLAFDIDGHVYHLFVVKTKERDKLIDYLKSHDIETKIHYPQPPHLSKAYKYLNYDEKDFPICLEYANTCLSLPFYNGMSDDEIDYIIEVLNRF